MLEYNWYMVKLEKAKASKKTTICRLARLEKKVQDITRALEKATLELAYSFSEFLSQRTSILVPALEEIRNVHINQCEKDMFEAKRKAVLKAKVSPAVLEDVRNKMYLEMKVKCSIMPKDGSYESVVLENIPQLVEEKAQGNAFENDIKENTSDVKQNAKEEDGKQGHAVAVTAATSTKAKATTEVLESDKMEAMQVESAMENSISSPKVSSIVPTDIELVMDDLVLDVERISSVTDNKVPVVIAIIDHKPPPPPPNADSAIVMWKSVADLKKNEPEFDSKIKSLGEITNASTESNSLVESPSPIATLGGESVQSKSNNNQKKKLAYDHDELITLFRRFRPGNKEDTDKIKMLQDLHGISIVQKPKLLPYPPRR